MFKNQSCSFWCHSCSLRALFVLQLQFHRTMQHFSVSFNMTFVISEGECICFTKSSIVAILSLEPPNPLHKSNYAISTWRFIVIIQELFSHDSCILRISLWQLCIHKFSNVVDIQSLQCRCILSILCNPTRKQPIDSLIGNSQFNTHLSSIWIFFWIFPTFVLVWFG